jgi:putative spermidine/putrescine transport system ATP-binding protein
MSMTASFIRLDRINKAFGPTQVVRDFNLGIAPGEFVSLLGPSGCGKTTTLRMIAGFETPSSGRIAIGGRDVTDLRPNQRKIGMVFQSYALFPNLTVAQNIGFGMKVAGASRADIDARVGEMMEIIKLPQHGKRYPFQLSGGQQQRVALARALAVRPQVLLLDEPLSALDAKIRVALREEIRSIQRKLGITTIYVTHDQEEALSMSDRIVVMHEGVAEQVGTPFEIYNRPATRFVASFVGTLNVLRATVLDPQGGLVRIGARELRLGRPLPVSQGGEISLSLRPEVISLGSHPGRPLELPGRVAEVSFLGSVIRVRMQVGDFHLSLDTFNNPAVAPPQLGEERMVSFSPEDVLVIPS